MEKDKKIINRQNINKDEKSEQIKKIAKQLLKEIGIKVNLLGFKYWQTALALVIEDEGKIVMMSLYCSVAKKHRTTAAKVERAMRYAYMDLNLKQIFKTDYPINNKALLFLLIDRIMNKIDIT